jgi:hypothetical protein
MRVSCESAACSAACNQDEVLVSAYCGPGRSAVTHTVEGQEGRLAWGRSSSAVADTKEPFAWAIASDNKTIVGADMDGYFRITLVGPEVLCPQRHEPEPIDRRDLLHDGSREMIGTSPRQSNRGGGQR